MSTCKVESFRIDNGGTALIDAPTQDKTTRIDPSLSFPPWRMKGYSNDGSRTEILLLLQMQNRRT
ncbi:hypothetical protein WS71_17520 [Burkholderia mayonis]|uniref:Uncharacterized protein n=1 Tax=Burkholderia mayonis TaxID=1385591 RepID=A0A1B4FZS0_9BURK|nr:hypothetical protein WS71_17520 [Burkholderia mayonis]KVE49990.1 hypothetical protein WS71_14745 [Burkholderia mayonis]